MSDVIKPLEVFYSYSRKDEHLRDRLEDHLSILKDSGVITGWHDRDIDANKEWEQQVDQHLNSADIILLLVSASFLSSPYSHSIEIERALERHETGEARVIPILLESVDLEKTTFAKLAGLPSNGTPITSWPNRDSALTDVANSIRKVGEELRSIPFARSATPSSIRTLDREKAQRIAKVWTVPHPRNPNFTGRDELITALREKLTSGQPAALTQAIHGLGGVGKTQLAIEYAYRYASAYDAVLWVRAEEPTTLAADFAHLGSELGITGLNTRDQDATIKDVLRWLRENHNWLLVFDNAPDGKQIAAYLPQGGSGHVLITSRNRHWRQYAQPIVVEVMTPDEAIKFLLTRTGQTDEIAAGQLAAELGYLPLALTQAGAYIEQKEKSLADYLPLVQKYRAKVLSPSDDYPTNLAATWELLFQAVREHSQTAAELLNLFAFFAPDDIPLGMVVAGAEYLPDRLRNAVLEPLHLDGIVGELGKYSLVEVDRDRDTISIHRLVQAVVRDRLSLEERQKWVEVALRVVDSGFSFRINDVSTWPIAAMVLPHALTVITSPDLQEPSSMEVGKLLSHLQNEVGLYLRHRAEYIDARDQLERALVIGEAVYGPDHPMVAVSLSNLGGVLRVLGDLQGARSYFERALAIGEAAYGPDHPTVAVRLSNLGSVLQDLGDLQGARSYFERALAIDEAVYGPDHPNVGSDLSNLGSVLKQLGDLQGARSYFERALVIGEAVYGPDHPMVAVSLSNLGGVLRVLGDLQGARSYFERALAIGEAAYGPDHPTVAVRLSNLGSVLQDLGDLQGARSYFERALAIDEAVYGPDHPNVAIRLLNLGGIFLQWGSREQALDYLESAHRIFLKFLGPEHPQTLNARRRLDMVVRMPVTTPGQVKVL